MPPLLCSFEDLNEGEAILLGILFEEGVFFKLTSLFIHLAMQPGPFVGPAGDDPAQSTRR